MAIPLGAAIGGVTSLVNMGLGLWQGAKANNLQKNLKRPEQVVQDEYVQNSRAADSMARTGMSQEQYNAGQIGIGRNMSSGIRALNNRSNPINGINSLVRASNDASNNLNIQDANMRQRNMLNAQYQRSILGGQKQAAWNWNSRDNYGEQLARIQALRGSSMQNVGNGLNSAANLGMIMTQGQMLGGGDNAGVGDQGGSTSSFSPSKFMSNAGMPSPIGAQPLGGYPFSGYGGMSNNERIYRID